MPTEFQSKDKCPICESHYRIKQNNWKYEYCSNCGERLNKEKSENK